MGDSFSQTFWFHKTSSNVSYDALYKLFCAETHYVSGISHPINFVSHVQGHCFNQTFDQLCIVYRMNALHY